MTDTFRPATTFTGNDLQPLRVRANGPVADYAHFAPHHVDGVEEDDGQINCICGFNEDDGNTVACDTCNKWQHIICYYPEYGDSLPDELQHDCVECRPSKPVNRQAAYSRQRDAQAQRHAMQNSVKRQPAKSHKKKVKDTPPVGHTNGWPMDKSRNDRNSASPRDLQPPAKRPKTSHRTSTSTVKEVNNQSRKRNGSTAQHRRSISRTPEPPTPIPLYSPEFIRAYQEDFQTTNTNVMGIPIYESMIKWIDNPDIVHELTGFELGSMVQRFDGPPDILEGAARLEIEEDSDTRCATTDGRPAIWKYVTVSEGLAKDSCIGELRGRLEFKEEYTTDPANRWALLRHPEPFVFLHGKLPICIDARHEGTLVRYIRRSCNPNAELRVIITGHSDYHFCFIALRDIAPGEEIAIAWEIHSEYYETYRRQMNGVPTEHMPKLYTWASRLLSNCGPCACRNSGCLITRLDKRDPNVGPEDEPAKLRKPVGKRKKNNHYISPLNTQAVNSRSGSEARKAEADDEPMDSRSVSGSGRRSGSRDITPNTHYSANGTTEMSERERKKLAKVEELFSKQEEEGTGKNNKKKRSSAGSTLHTPNATSSKQLGHPAVSKHADTGTSRLPNKNATVRRSKPSNLTKQPSKPANKALKPPKPEYTTTGVQCEMSDEEEQVRRSKRPAVQRHFIPLQQRLRERCARNNAMRRDWLTSTCKRPPQKKTEETVSPGPAAVQAKSPNPSTATKASLPPSASEDVEMEDASPEDSAVTAPSAVPSDSPPTASLDKPAPGDSTAHPPTDPPPPPWPSESAAHKPSPSPSSDAPKPHDIDSAYPHKQHPAMHLTMPPPPTHPFSSAHAHSSNPSPLLTPSGIAQSPASLTQQNSFASAGSNATPPIFSPSVAAAVQPSPARKKLSLSDYTRRSKAKDKDAPADNAGKSGTVDGSKERDRESSPASVASGPSVSGPAHRREGEEEGASAAPAG